MSLRRGANTVLASDCRAQFGHPSTTTGSRQCGCRAGRTERQCAGKQMRLPPSPAVCPNKTRERKISPKFFRPKFCRGRPRGMSVPKCLFFPDLEGLTEVFGWMSAGTSARKLPLWADFFVSEVPPSPLCALTKLKLQW